MRGDRGGTRSASWAAAWTRWPRRLAAALTELESANQALRGEVERERELDRQRMAFFSAASHELKTPVTILKGQLSGMLEGVGVYQDRDKYLLRSLQVTGRMENLVRGDAGHLPDGDAACGRCKREPVDLSALMERQLALDAELLEQRGQRLVSELTPGVTVTGDAALLGKAVGNLLSNASLYSPEGARDTGVVRDAGRPSRPDGGEHRGPHQRGGPAPPVRGLLPGGGLPEPRPPAAAAWGCIW